MALIKAQELTRNQIRIDLPHYSDKELWRAVIVCRLGARANLELTNLSLGIGSDGSEAVMERMESMDATMDRINSWEDVINYVLEMDKESLSYDPMGVKAELNRIIMD